MKQTIKFLKSKEWETGYCPQCPECRGCKPRVGWWTKTVGHSKKCILAKCLEELGVKVVWERKNHSKKVREFYKQAKDICEQFKSYDN